MADPKDRVFLPTTPDATWEFESREKELRERIQEINTMDPDDLMLVIMEVLQVEVLYPQPPYFYTFVYKPKTPNITYDQYPLIECQELFKWGFRGFNFHWRKSRNYTWAEIIGKLHIIRYDEMNTMLSIPYQKIQINK